MRKLVLVTGSDGLVGSRFVELYPNKNYLHLPTEVELDITNAKEVKNIISSYKFSAVINFAAFTDVSAAEKERGDKNGACWRINVEGVKNIVNAINPVTTRFVQISTDMVFSGLSNDPGPYEEEHKLETNEVNLTWYGWTKAAADKYVLNKLGDKASILRIIYPVRAKFIGKLDYLRKSLKLFDENKLHPLFTDQQISLTFIDEAVHALDLIVNRDLPGVFHASSPDTTTPYEIVSYLISKARNYKGELDKVTLGEFLKQTGSSVMRYPKYGGLEVKKTQQELGLHFSGWREIVDRLVSQGIEV